MQVKMQAKSRKSLAPTPAPVAVAVRTKAVVSDYESSFLSLSSDSDEDMPSAAGDEFYHSPTNQESKTSAVGSGNCRCFVCGEIFGSMAAMNFHSRKKH